MTNKIDEVKEKLVEVINKKLDNETITSRELFDYAQILSNLKSAEEYKETMKTAFAALGTNNGFNSGGFLN